jgi:DNA-binding beta-propeller fold protein YncE
MGASRARSAHAGTHRLVLAVILAGSCAVAVLTARPGPALAAGNSGPSGLTLQVTAPPPPAQDVYISDAGNNRVLKVTPNGTQTAVGSGFDSPAQVAVDAAGDVYVADMENNRVEEVTPAGVQTTVISGLDAPAGVAVDSEGDVYVSNTGNSTILEVSPGGAVTTVATGLLGDSLAVDAAGDLFVAANDLDEVVELAADGSQTTVGTGLNQPFGVSVDPAGDVYIADSANERVLEVTPSGTETVVKKGLQGPVGVASDAEGDVFIAEAVGNEVIEVTPGGTTTAVGSGLADPYSVAVSPVAATQAQAQEGVTLTASALPAGSNGPTGTVQFFDGSTLLGDSQLAVSTSGLDQATLTTTALPAGTDTVTAKYLGDIDYPGAQATAQVDVTALGSGLTVRPTSPPPAAQDVYIADTGNNRVVKVTPAGLQTTVPATGLSGPTGVAVNNSGDVYIADTGNNRVVKVTPAGLQTVVDDQVGAPAELALDAAGDVFIADQDDNRAVEVTPGGLETTVSTQRGGTPQGAALSTGAYLFVAYTDNNDVVKVTPSGTSSGFDSTGLSSPEGLADDLVGDVYIANTGDNQVVEVTAAGTTTTIGSGLSAPADVAVGPPTSTASTFGTSVTLTANAFPAGPGGPTGTVTFTVGGTVLGTATLSENSFGVDHASVTTTALPAGTDTIKASYSGDSAYRTSSATCILSVQLALGPGTLPEATKSASYTATITAAGGTAPYTFSLASGTLPPGLSLASSGVLSGKPTTAGTFSFVVKAKDSSSPARTGEISYSLVVQS